MRLEQNYSAKRLLYKFKIDLWGNFIMQRKLTLRITKRVLMDYETILRMRFFKQLRSSRIYTSRKQEFFKQWRAYFNSKNFTRKINKKNNSFIKKYQKQKQKKPQYIWKKFNYRAKKRKFSKFYRFRFQKKYLSIWAADPKDSRYKFSKYYKTIQNLKNSRKKFRFIRIKNFDRIKKNYRFNILKLKFISFKIKILKKFYLNQQKIFFKNNLLKLKYNYYIKKFSGDLSSFDKSALKKLFFFNLFNYTNYYKNKFVFASKLESIWMKTHLVRLKFVVPKLWGKVYHQGSLKYTYKRPYKKISTMNYHNKVELLKQLNFFCFSTLGQTRKFLKRIEFLKRPDPIFLGLEGCFLNILFRTNLFITTKQIYTFIKLGAFQINNQIIYNPYKILSIFDSFSVNKKFFYTIWSIFLDKIRNDLILVNIPNYLDYDYKLLNFFIWRLPTELESRFVYSFPFFRPLINYTKKYPPKFQNISPLEYEPPRKYKF